MVKRDLLLDKLATRRWKKSVVLTPPYPWESLKDAKARMLHLAKAAIQGVVQEERARRRILAEETKRLRDETPGDRNVVRVEAIRLEYFTLFLLNQNPALSDDEVMNTYSRLHPKASSDSAQNAVRSVALLTQIELMQRRLF